MAIRQLKISNSIANRESAALQKYLQEIGKIPLISAEREVELAIRIHQGDEEALEELTKANLRFVVSVAKQYQNNGIPLLDLINEGNLGLIEAGKRFDETRGFKFISYAVWWIRQSILFALGQQGRMVRIPLNRLGLQNKINKAILEFEQEFHCEPSNEQLAHHLGVSVDEITITRRSTQKHASFDAPLGEDNDGTMYDIVEDTSTNLEKNLHNDEAINVMLNRGLEQLSSRRMEYIVRLAMGFGLKHAMSLEDIGEAIDPPLTRERVRQIKDKGIHELRINERIRLGLKKNEIGYMGHKKKIKFSTTLTKQEEQLKKLVESLTVTEHEVEDEFESQSEAVLSVDGDNDNIFSSYVDVSSFEVEQAKALFDQQAREMKKKFDSLRVRPQKSLVQKQERGVNTETSEDKKVMSFSRIIRHTNQADIEANAATKKRKEETEQEITNIFNNKFVWTSPADRKKVFSLFITQLTESAEKINKNIKVEWGPIDLRKFTVQGQLVGKSFYETVVYKLYKFDWDKFFIDMDYAEIQGNTRFVKKAIEPKNRHEIEQQKKYFIKFYEYLIAQGKTERTRRDMKERNEKDEVLGETMYAQVVVALYKKDAKRYLEAVDYNPAGLVFKETPTKAEKEIQRKDIEVVKKYFAMFHDEYLPSKNMTEWSFTTLVGWKVDGKFIGQRLCAAIRKIWDGDETKFLTAIGRVDSVLPFKKAEPRVEVTPQKLNGLLGDFSSYLREYLQQHEVWGPHTLVSRKKSLHTYLSRNYRVLCTDGVVRTDWFYILTVLLQDPALIKKFSFTKHAAKGYYHISKATLQKEIDEMPTPSLPEKIEARLIHTLQKQTPIVQEREKRSKESQKKVYLQAILSLTANDFATFIQFYECYLTGEDILELVERMQRRLIAQGFTPKYKFNFRNAADTI